MMQSLPGGIRIAGDAVRTPSSLANGEYAEEKKGKKAKRIAPPLMKAEKWLQGSSRRSSTT